MSTSRVLRGCFLADPRALRGWQLPRYQEPGREVLAGAIAYLMDHNGEAGHACPVACTAGAVKLLQRLGTPEQQMCRLRQMMRSLCAMTTCKSWLTRRTPSPRVVRKWPMRP